MSYYGVTLDEAIEKVKAGEWKGEYELEKGIIHIGSPDGWASLILSVGYTENLFFNVVPERKKELVDAGITVEENCSKNGEFHCFINTKHQYSWISICNFRRYGWCWAPGRQAEEGYNGIITANGDVTFLKQLDPEVALRVELARLVGQLQERFDDVRILHSYNFKKGCEILVEDALKHDQLIHLPTKNKDEDEVHHFIDALHQVIA